MKIQRGRSRASGALPTCIILAPRVWFAGRWSWLLGGGGTEAASGGAEAQLLILGTLLTISLAASPLEVLHPAQFSLGVPTSLRCSSLIGSLAPGGTMSLIVGASRIFCQETQNVLGAFADVYPNAQARAELRCHFAFVKPPLTRSTIAEMSRLCAS